MFSEFQTQDTRTGCINDIQVKEGSPQGLKPLVIPASFGTTEVVP